MIHVPIELFARSETLGVASGAAWKLARCEKCGTEYVYLMRRMAVGRESTSLLFGADREAEARAYEYAGMNLGWELRTEVDPVPCPDCGHYQADMVEAVRRRATLFFNCVGPYGYLVGLGAVGVGVMLLTAILLGWNEVTDPEAAVVVHRLGILAAAVSIGVGLVVLAVRVRGGDRLRSRYEPNWPNRRPPFPPAAVGIRRADFERQVAANQRREQPAPPPIPLPSPGVARPPDARDVWDRKAPGPAADDVQRLGLPE